MLFPSIGPFFHMHKSQKPTEIELSQMQKLSTTPFPGLSTLQTVETNALGAFFRPCLDADLMFSVILLCWHYLGMQYANNISMLKRFTLSTYTLCTAVGRVLRMLQKM